MVYPRRNDFTLIKAASACFIFVLRNRDEDEFLRLNRLQFFRNDLVDKINCFLSKELHLCTTMAIFEIPYRMTDKWIAVIIESVDTVVLSDIRRGNRQKASLTDGWSWCIATTTAAAEKG